MARSPAGHILLESLLPWKRKRSAFIRIGWLQRILSLKRLLSLDGPVAEASSQQVSLPEYEPEIFELFSDWLYDGTLFNDCQAFLSSDSNCQQTCSG
jgi:hypothetical protein